MSWRRFFTRHARDVELAKEIDQYIAQETDDNLARGMSANDARRAAIRKFGSRRAVRETVYTQNGINWLDTLRQDVRYGLRQLRRQPGFTMAAVLSLALGIGANTALFTLIDQLLLQRLPVANPRELVQLRVDGVRPGGNWGDGLHTFPFPTYLALRDRNTVFSGLTGQRVEPVSLLDDHGSAAVTAALVAGNYFEVFGVRPHLGRVLTPDDDRHVNGHPVVVLQYDFWRAQYQGRAEILGETVRLNGTPFTVVGVAAEGFDGTDVARPASVFIPVTMQPAVVPTNPRLDEERAAWFYPFARLKAGVTLAQAEKAMKRLYRQQQDEELQQSYFGRFPETRDGFLRQTFTLEPADRGESGVRNRFERPLLLLECLAVIVLLIACANVAGLLLARSAAGHRDLSIRRAIGASRWRIARQLFTESAMLAAISAVAALVLGTWLTRGLLALLSTAAGDISLSASPDVRVLAFTFVVATLTTLAFGLLPAWQGSGARPAATLRDGMSATADQHRHVRLRKAFVAVQIGLSVVLLLGAGLFVRSLDNLQRIELGLNSENVVTFFARPAITYDTAKKVQVYGTLVQQLAAVPGVVAIGAGRTPLFNGSRSDGVLTIAGAGTGGPEPFSFFNAVTPGYFEALQIPITSGRTFEWRDWGAGKHLALVNERLARTAFEEATPLDRMVGRGTRADTTDRIIGVVGNARYHDVKGDIPPQTYQNLDSVVDGVSRIVVYARVSGPPREMMPRLRDEARRIDPAMVITDMRTLDEQIGSRMSNERMLSALSLGFALVAVVLAVVGVHGVLVFQVARRTREIGVRMALGAGRGLIVRLIAREMVLVILAGLVAGTAASYAGGRFIQSQLFEMRADDPLVFAVAVGTLLAVAGVATVVPALRAARTNVVQALRYD